jgi:hypothetical protein
MEEKSSRNKEKRTGQFVKPNKRYLALGTFAAVAVVGSGALLLRAGKLPSVTMVLAPEGVKSLKVDNVEFLENGELQVSQAILKKPDGETYLGSTSGRAEFDAAQQRLTKTFPWGKVKINYAASENHATFTITTANTSDSETIQGLWFQPIVLRFPEKLKEYDGTIPLLVHNVGQPGVITVSYGSGTLAVVSEDIDQQLMVGFPWALNRPESTIFPLTVNTDRVKSYPDSYPYINRPIAPGGTDQYRVTLRFGTAKMTEAKLAGDIYKKFSQTFPAQLRWTDHRPIGAVSLASVAQEWPHNPRGWFGDTNSDYVTPAGRAKLRERILSTADGAIEIMRQMDAQGAVTWDLEGQQFSHAIGYVGDPRMLSAIAPEMDEIADEYIERFHRAGLRTGLLIRPQAFKLSDDKKTGTQDATADPAQLLIDKIAYAKKRWGVSLIYIDSNINPKDPNPIDTAIIQKVAATFPDCLLIPEHSTLRYYAYSAPYKELRLGFVSTPEMVRETYPDAFTSIYTADGPLDLYHDDLAAAVKHGDSVIYRTWYADPQNEKIKTLYVKHSGL